MPVSVSQTILVILVCAVCTYQERLLPFLVFSRGEPPKWVGYLGKVLPTAIMATLVVYCLRDTTFESPGGFAPQAIAVAVTAGLHLWRKNTLLSVLGGTAAYMLLVQFVF